MCNFFSVVSNGRGVVKFFKPEDVVKIMSEGNGESYDFNSHTSLMHFLGIKGGQEDKWNKWEYDPDKKALEEDSLVTKDDRKDAQEVLEEYFSRLNIAFMRNLYGGNSGYRNSGDRNSGYRNSGDWNSGDRNSGYQNSGDQNSGNWNSGDRNSGYRNSGNWNSGNQNSGDYNSTDRSSGIFCSTPDKPRLFNKRCSKKEYEIAMKYYVDLRLTEWVCETEMTQAEKEANEFCTFTGGYLKTRSYKEAWAVVAEKNPEKIEEAKKLPNFDSEVFEEITGIKI